MYLGKYPYDEEYKDYINKMGDNDEPQDELEDDEDCSCNRTKKTDIFVNCNLKVDFDTKNKVIYLYPGRIQYFTVDILKSCGDVKIKCIDHCKDNKICGNLGIYKIVKSGILVETFYKLDKRKKDILNFVAVDTCTGECYEFAVIFSFKKCCYC